MSNRTAPRTRPTHVPAGARVLMLAGGSVHIAYGIGSLFVPERMVSAKYAPDTHALADPRLLLRAFGGHLLLSGCLVLAATSSPKHARSATALCLLTNASDVTSALLELRTRRGGDQTVTGGIALSGVGVLTFAAALRALPPSRSSRSRSACPAARPRTNPE